MKTRFLILFIVVLLALSPACAAEKSADKPQFHPPQTEAERVLDSIVKIAVSQPDMFQIVLRNPRHDLSRAGEFESLFTKFFLSEWRKLEKELVDKYCGGTYASSSKDCGYDLNPVSCQVSGDPPYLYRTVVGDNNEAAITLTTLDDSTDEAVYYMKRENGAWKMGGLYCEEEIPDTTPSKELVRKFLPPKQESERGLENILHLARTDGSLLPFIFDLKGRDYSKDQKYAMLFSQSLLAVWRHEAKKIMDHDCSEGYDPKGSGSCDFFSHPVFCTMAYEDDFLVKRTVSEQGHESTITYSYPGGHPKLRFIYHMLKDGREWKIDGVDCDDNRKFNIP